MKGKQTVRKLELLAPAANADIAIQAILHGADAVYMGGPSHGARKAAANPIDDIARVVDFAHNYRARVYVTVNTIVFEDELKRVEQLCRDLYHAGVDALIVQDMALLRMSLPPIALHASTQCDIRTPQKARFLQDVGFSQIVLARELTLREIREIVETVDIPVECFVHGALCVSYSGRCHASCATTRRSANRGECSQICRHSFTLTDDDGKVLARNKHLLSLRDFNATASLHDLIDAGVSSFKIEGRLKDMAYVKNITAHYNNEINRLIADNDNVTRSSFGDVTVGFEPDPVKSFNRGFTDYFLNQRRPDHLASLRTPKSMGEIIRDVKMLHNGDGISFFDAQGNYTGANVNALRNNEIITSRPVDIPKGTEIHRTLDIEWEKKLARQTAERKIPVDITLNSNSLSATDVRGVSVRIAHDLHIQDADKPTNREPDFAKLGATPYVLSNYTDNIGPGKFIPRSELSALRRELVHALDQANTTTFPFDLRRPENIEAQYVVTNADYKTNIANTLAEQFYRDHGVKNVQAAMEVSGNHQNGTVLMTTRHCILRELGICKRLKKNVFKEPLILSDDANRYRLHFNCADCEMEVISNI